jgi:hypothetical protein
MIEVRRAELTISATAGTLAIAQQESAGGTSA